MCSNQSERGSLAELCCQPRTEGQLVTTTKKPARGRPRREKKVSEARLVARCSPTELEAAEREAKLQGVSLSDFIREAVEGAVQMSALQRSSPVREQKDYERSMSAFAAQVKRGGK